MTRISDLAHPAHIRVVGMNPFCATHALSQQQRIATPPLAHGLDTISTFWPRPLPDLRVRQVFLVACEKIAVRQPPRFQARTLEQWDLARVLGNL